MPEHPPSHHILIVDDQVDVLDVISDLLHTDGYRTTGATNGAEALAIIRRESVDLVIVDLMMPGMNGWRVLREIKTYDTTIPVVVLTGFITEQSESILTSQQADGYLVKPVEHSRLKILLRNLLAAPSSAQSGAIVVVDDDDDVCRAIEHALARRGLTTTAFNAIPSALDHIRQTHPDLIILEIVFPEASGFDLCRRLQEHPETADIPVIVLTAEASRQNLMQAIQLRVRGFIAKPFAPNEVAERILKILRRPG